jgi:hypothetical protein
MSGSSFGTDFAHEIQVCWILNCWDLHQVRTVIRRVRVGSAPSPLTDDMKKSKVLTVTSLNLNSGELVAFKSRSRGLPRRHESLSSPSNLGRATPGTSSSATAEGRDDAGWSWQIQLLV